MHPVNLLTSESTFMTNIDIQSYSYFPQNLYTTQLSYIQKRRHGISVSTLHLVSLTAWQNRIYVIGSLLYKVHLGRMYVSYQRVAIYVLYVPCDGELLSENCDSTTVQIPQDNQTTHILQGWVGSSNPLVSLFKQESYIFERGGGGRRCTCSSKGIRISLFRTYRWKTFVASSAYI